MTKLNFLLVSALLAGNAVAAPITGSSGMGVPTVPGATSTIDFDSLSSQTFGSLSVGGVTIAGLGGQLRISNEYIGRYNARGKFYVDNNASFDSDYTKGIQFTFDNAVSAFAFNFGASNDDWVLSAFSSTNNLIESINAPVTLGSNEGEYVGIAAAGIKYATLTTSAEDDWVFIENLTLSGTSNDVPEPASLGLMGLGLMGLVASRRTLFKK